MRQALLPAIALAALAAPAAPALAERESLSLSLAERRLATQPTQSGEPLDDNRPGEPPAQAGGEDLSLSLDTHRFGERGSWYWSVGVMGTLSEDATDARLDYTVRVFLADDFEFNLSLAGWGFFQDHDDALGLNPGLAFRWHFINNHDAGYSIYAQTGIGLLWATDEVPHDGTRFNFTPHVGVGATLALPDTAARLDLGLGWHHISNASTSGSDDNPARDSLAVWVGVIFPF